jgi:arylsulfatase A-like enzyme
MRPPKPPAVLVAACVALAAVACGRTAPAPNIVLVSVDTLRSDALRAYDPQAPELPTLDALAASSARFEHAVAPAAWTLPSHASLLTGVYPHRHGAVHRKATLARSVPTLASLLWARGYETVAFTDGGFLDPSYGFGRGFTRYDDRLSGGVEPLPWIPRFGRPGPAGNSDLFARADAFLAHRQAAEPLFLFVHTFAVHDYYRAHDPDHSLACLTGNDTCAPEEWEALAGHYRAALRRLDGGVARLLEAVRAGLADRPTYVVLLSDHGEGLDPAQGHTHHGGALRPDVLSVPLLVSGPGVEARDVATPVSLVDVAPTLLALAGNSERPLGRGAAGAPSADFDGTSLAPLLSGGARARLAALALASRSLHAEEHSYWWRDGRRHAARDAGTRALAVGVLRGGWWYSKTPHHELAERLDGPAGGAPPLHALREAARPFFRAPAVATDPHAESAELEASLRALGYGGGGAP